MALNPRLQNLFTQRNVRFELIPHTEAYTAQGVAHRSHVPGRTVAKVVVIRDDVGSDVMLVLPAPEHFDRAAVRRVTGCEGPALENESELLRLFPDCEVGAMPPFGGLYGMPMYVDPCLESSEHIHFQAGNHHELVRVRWDDYARVAQPYRTGACLHREVESHAG